ncbi:MAG TPA: fumarylacetoacetate hydrolase family protein [Bauldia sp.]|nr:fumarylacetoacetate hydrolase family protein [Bauldia sp.]
MQDYLEFRHPCSGGMFDGTVARDRISIPRDKFVRVGIECEIAARIARDVPTGPFTAERMAGEVAAWMPSMEIVEDRFGDFRRIDPHTLVADDFFNWGGVLGPEAQATPEAIANMTGTTTINGVVVGTGRGSDVLGHPLNVLAWLAESLVARGTFLRAGEIVTTGSVVETKWMERGDRAVISIAGLGEASLELT